MSSARLPVSLLRASWVSPFLRHVVADSAFRYAKMFGDFLGGFFVFGEQASSGIPHNFSGEIHAGDFIRSVLASSFCLYF
jgi:hypothetical protein